MPWGPEKTKFKDKIAKKELLLSSTDYGTALEITDDDDFDDNPIPVQHAVAIPVVDGIAAPRTLRPIKLSKKNCLQLLIPRGFAHGFIVLSKSATVNYKVDNNYMPDYDSGIIYNDESIGVDWHLDKKYHIVSVTDKQLPNINALKLNDDK